MENLRDKMLKAIAETTFEVDERLAEACARVAEEEIAKVIDAIIDDSFEEGADAMMFSTDEDGLDQEKYRKMKYESIADLKEKYKP